jgi:nucleoside-diphosphate-sugar epimerase
METHAHQLIGQPLLEKGKVSILGQGDSPRNFVAVNDVARLIKMVLDKPQTKGEIIENFDPTPTLQKYRLELTSLETFVAEKVASGK